MVAVCYNTKVSENQRSESFLMPGFSTLQFKDNPAVGLS